MAELETQAYKAILENAPRPVTNLDGTPRLDKDGRQLFRARVSVTWKAEDVRATSANVTAPHFDGEATTLGRVRFKGLRVNLYEIDGKPGWNLKADRVVLVEEPK